MTQHKLHCRERKNVQIGERRLLGFSPTQPESMDNLQETVQAHEQIEKNPHIKKVLALYDNPIVRSRFGDLLSSQSYGKPYLLTLIADGVLDKGTVPADFDYRTLSVTDIDPADPFNIVGNPPKTADQLGQFLLTIELPEPLLAQIHPNWRTDPVGLGTNYLQILSEGRAAWRDPNRDINSESQLFVDVSLHYFKFIEKTTNERLEQIGVRKPTLSMEHGLASQIDPLIEESMLTKEEYLLLLRSGAKQGHAFPYRDVVQLRGAIDPQPEDKRTRKVFTDMSVTKFGPTETLKRFGIELGPYLKQEYADARMGIERDSTGVEHPPLGRPYVASASEWRRNPTLAFDFLTNHLPTGIDSPNKVFLDSLEWYYVLKEDEDNPRGKPDPLLDKADVEAGLYLIVQSLMDYEGRFSETSRQRKDLKSEISTGQKLENFMGNAWEYMNDFSSHPLGSALAWLAAIQAARIVWQNFFGPGKTKVWKLALLGGAALAMYQQNQNGRSFLNWFGDKYDNWMGNEKLKNGNERTLPNYWVRELKNIKGEPGFYDDLTPDKERACLAMIGEAPVNTMIDWYEQWGVWRNNPKGKKPEMPLQYGKYRNLFGQSANREQMGNYLYLTMHKFFVHRGQEVRAAQLPFNTPAGMSEDEGLGFAYVKEKYMNHLFYRKLVEDMGIPKNLEIGDLDVIEWKDEDGAPISKEQAKELYPEFYEKYEEMMLLSEEELRRHLLAMRYLMRLYKTETMGSPTKAYPFDHVFFMEGNPERMAKVDAENAEAAGFLGRMGASLSSWWKGPQGRNGPSGAPGALTRLPMGNPGQMVTLATTNPGVFRQLAIDNPGQMTTLATTNPGMLRQISQANQGLFLNLATDNPGMLSNMATANPGEFFKAAETNAGIFTVMAAQNAGQFQALATAHPDKLLQVATANPGALHNLSRANVAVFNQLANAHPDMVKQIATGSPAEFFKTAKTNPALLQQFATLHPDDFLTIADANVGSVQSLAKTNPQVFHDLSTANPAFFLQLSERRPEILKEMVTANPAQTLVTAAGNPKILTNLAVKNPTEFLALPTADAVQFQQVINAHPAVFNDIKTNAPGTYNTLKVDNPGLINLP